jgi:hypothetical protein
MANSPMIQQKDDLQIHIKSLIREETLQAFVILTIILEYSDEAEEEISRDEGIPIELWRSWSWVHSFVYQQQC